MTFPHIHGCDDDPDDDGPGFPDMAAMRSWHQAYAEMQMEQRRIVKHWGAVICSCRRRFDWTFTDTQPPQADCSVHGVIAFNPMTGEML